MLNFWNLNKEKNYHFSFDGNEKELKKYEFPPPTEARRRVAMSLPSISLVNKSWDNCRIFSVGEINFFPKDFDSLWNIVDGLFVDSGAGTLLGGILDVTVAEGGVAEGAAG